MDEEVMIHAYHQRLTDVFPKATDLSRRSFVTGYFDKAPKNSAGLREGEKGRLVFHGTSV